MKKRLFLCLLVLLLLALCACGEEGETVPYETEHEHIFGASYDILPEEGGALTQQVRYCKICHAEQVHPK